MSPRSVSCAKVPAEVSISHEVLKGRQVTDLEHVGLTVVDKVLAHLLVVSGNAFIDIGCGSKYVICFGTRKAGGELEQRETAQVGNVVLIT